MKILLIEDNPGDARMVKEMLTETTHIRAELEYCDCFSTGRRGLERGNIDLILLDLGLPDSTGLETFFKVHSLALEVPIIVMTGLDDDESTNRALQAGAQDYLIKGQVDADLLGRAIRYAYERKQAEHALLKSEERYRMLVERMNDGVVTADQDGIIYFANLRFCSMLGYKSDELMGKQFIKLLNKLSLNKWLANQEKRKQGMSTTYELELIRKNGDSLFCIASGNPVLDAKGNFRGSTGILTDITEQKALEDTLRQSQKMESVGTLAGGVAHEFNNILSGIMGYTELARDDTPKESPVRESLNEILKLGNRARDVVSQILSFSRKEKKERNPILPHLAIKESIKVLNATIPTTIEIKHNIDENSGTILAEPTQINQIGTNLCMNAAHAMEESGGVLEIGLAPVVLDAEDVKPYTDLKPGEYVKLTVSDTGTGIDSKNIDKIFDPFFTTKGVGKGTGMGLSVVHGIIKDHGGAITVSSKLGEGTTFTVLLPKTQGEIEKAKIDDAIQAGTENILVVDDEEHLAFLMKTILGRLGYTVTALTSSLDALEFFKRDPQQYDLVITDLTMPHLTGDKLASEIIAIRPDMPVILATGYADAVDSEKVKQSGIKAFIPKPCQKQNLAKTIRLILDEK